MNEKKDTSAHEQKIQQATAELGGPRIFTAKTKLIIVLIACSWSLFQLWYASPLPFIFKLGVFNDTEARSIHLAFAIFLAFICYPAKRSNQSLGLPWFDFVLACLGAFSAAYIYLFYESLSLHSGAPQTRDLIVSGMGMLLLLEATRRTLGPPLTVVASVFLFYCFAGPLMPDIIAHKGVSFSRAMSHFWLTTEGVFGVALGVSTNFVFLFVLFGALLEKAGAGNYFIRLSFALLGQLRGGPAKAAVVSSGLSGIISGSSIANVVTTGTFTIPLMKKVGFPASKAGAIEVAASTNGQLTPPIMGAAAFLMVEYVGISYIEVIKAAVLPALISYIALFYIVHLEALKANMSSMPRERNLRFIEWVLGGLASVIMLCVISLATYYGVGWIKTVAGPYAIWMIAALLLCAYVALVRLAASKEDLPTDIEINKAPRIRRTATAGLYFLLPIIALIWCLAIERFSPGLSAFWATVFMLFIILTHRPLKATFRQQKLEMPSYQGLIDLFEGLEAGASSMISIGIATATAGIVVGTVTLTGIGLIMTSFVEFISAGNIVLVLFFTAIISLILGMGLPTTANYIVVSTLMAPVIVELGAQNGLIVPLIAVHLFVFYFGILADDTPPVGLAAFAASGIAQSDPIKTGLQGFTYDIRTAILPFMFIFNTQLLLLNIDSWSQFILVIFSSLGAMLIFAAATQGFWFVKNRWYETLGLLLVTFLLFRPDFFWSYLYPPYNNIPAQQISTAIKQVPKNDSLRIVFTGENIDGKTVTTTANLPLGPQASVKNRLIYAGLELRNENNEVLVDNVLLSSPAEKAGIDFDWQITRVELKNTLRPNPHWIFLPTLLLLAAIYYNQKRRQKPKETIH